MRGVKPTAPTAPRPAFLSLFFLLVLFPAALHSFQRSQLLPADPDILLRVSGGSALMGAMAASPAGRLWNAPEMRPFQDNQNLEDALLQYALAEPGGLSENKQAAGLHRQTLNLMKNEILLALSAGNTPDANAYHLIAEMDSPAFLSLLDLIRREKALLKTPFAAKTRHFQGRPITEIISGDAENPRSDYFMHYRNTTFATNRRPWLEACIVRLREKEPESDSSDPSVSLSLSNLFLRRFFASGAIAGDHRPPDEEADDAGAPASGDPDSPNAFYALGFNHIRRATLEWRFTPRESEMNLTLEQDGEGGGLWKILSGEVIPARYSPPFFPRDAVSCHIMRLDPELFWSELPLVFHRLYPRGAEQFDVFQKVMAEMLGVDLYRDVIYHADALLTIFSRLENAEGENIYFWQLRQPEGMEKTLAKLFVRGGMLQEQFQDNLEMVETGDCTLYILAIPSEAPAAANTEGETVAAEPPGAEAAPPSMVLKRYAIGVRDGDLVFGSAPFLLDFIRDARNPAPGHSPLETVYHETALRRIPPDVNGCGVIHIYQWLRTTAGILKSMTPAPAEGDESSGAPASEAPPHPLARYLAGLRFDKLPAPEWMASFFGPAFGYYQYHNGRLRLSWVFLNPEPPVPAARRRGTR